jgi:purine nucleoside phosphorylase
MLITDHINYSGMNPLIGQHGRRKLRADDQCL